MKILKLKTASGYKMLEENFNINFLTKTRIDKSCLNEELLKLEENLYYPVETIFIGKNSSGKTTTLDFVSIAIEILLNGRIPSSYFNNGDKFNIEIIFYSLGNIYKYVANFIFDSIRNSKYLIIEDEELFSSILKPTHKKDLSNVIYTTLKNFDTNIGGDTSSIHKYIDKSTYNITTKFDFNNSSNFSLYYSMLGEEIFNSLIKLFDDSVEYLKPLLDLEIDLKDGYIFKRIESSNHIIVDSNTLNKILSSGTIRGINLYALAILTFRNGGQIVVDEIEKNFNKNLIENLLLMYEDPSINKHNGSIIYSTHYAELLDLGDRCDNVNVLHRIGNSIKLKNMCSDYDIRVDMLKSSSFNENVFDTLINYERLMDLKDNIRNK